MSIWTRLSIELALYQILSEQQPSSIHPHLGRPYLTPYQIAIELSRSFPEIAAELRKPVGGKGVEQHDSIAQYLAREMSHRIALHKLPGVEGALISDQDVTELTFTGGVSSSVAGASHLSAFRLTT